jgi:hypothetical protein
MVNENLLDKQDPMSSIRKKAINNQAAVMGGFHSAPAGKISDPDRTTSFFARLLKISEGHDKEYPGDPDSYIAIPIFDTLHGANRTVVGIVETSIYWRWFLHNLLPDDHEGVHVVIENACDGSFTYLINGPQAIALGFGDRHDPRFHAYRVDGSLNRSRIDDGTVHGMEFHKHSCPYTFQVYPSQLVYDEYFTQEPVLVSLSVAAVFLFAIAMFILYDRLVERRQRLILAKATQSTAIVSSLFVSSKT